MLYSSELHPLIIQVVAFWIWQKVSRGIKSLFSPLACEMSFSLSLLVKWLGFISFTTEAWVWFPLRELLAFGETLGISQKLGTTAEKVILFWVSDLRTVANSRTLCCYTNIPIKGQQVKISSLREIYFLSSTCHGTLLSKSWRKPQEKSTIFRAGFEPAT